MSHFMVQCEAHGTVIQQCRCPGIKVIETVPCPGKPGCDGHVRPWKLAEPIDVTNMAGDVVMTVDVALAEVRATFDRHEAALRAIVHEDPTDRYDGFYCHYCEGENADARNDPMEIEHHETHCPYRLAVEALA